MRLSGERVSDIGEVWVHRADRRYVLIEATGYLHLIAGDIIGSSLLAYGFGTKGAGSGAWYQQVPNLCESLGWTLYAENYSEFIEKRRGEMLSEIEEIKARVNAACDNELQAANGR